MPKSRNINRFGYSGQEQHAEVEFIRVEDGNVIPVEVKSGWITKAKSIRTFQEKYHTPCRVIMSANNVLFDGEHKVYKYPLYLAYPFPLIRS